jgi:hypothetical protein
MVGKDDGSDYRRGRRGPCVKILIPMNEKMTPSKLPRQLTPGVSNI